MVTWERAIESCIREGSGRDTKWLDLGILLKTGQLSDKLQVEHLRDWNTQKTHKIAPTIKSVAI